MRTSHLATLGLPFLLLLLLLPQASSQDCPASCTCSENASVVSVNCSALSSFPKFTKNVQNITILGLEDNNFTEVSVDNINYLTNLHTLKLNKNGISSIQNGTFSSNAALQHVLLGHNELDLLDTGVFCHLESLIYLDLKYNHVARLRAFTFHNLSSLTTVDLSNNALSVVDVNAFTEVPNMTYLYLTNNLLTSVPSHVFHFTKNLKFLHLEHNNISALQNYAFSPMKDLKKLFLSGNKFSKLDNWAFQLNASHGLTLNEKEIKLQHLEMINCELHDIPLALDDLFELAELDLSNNNFTVIKSATFFNLARLKYLRIDRIMELKEVHLDAFINLQNMQSLHLSNCPNLTKLPRLMLMSSDNLLSLDLSGNGLTSIPETTTHWDKLRYLNLQRNKIQCDCEAEWIQKRILSKKWPTAQMLNSVHSLNCYDNVGIEKLRDFNFRSLGCEQEAATVHHTEKLLTGLVAALVVVVVVLLVCLAVRFRKKIQSKYRHFKYLRHTDEAPFTIDTKYSDLDAKDARRAPNHVDVYRDEKDDENLI